jgi:hypothetical protein
MSVMIQPVLHTHLKYSHYQQLIKRTHLRRQYQGTQASSHLDYNYFYVVRHRFKVCFNLTSEESGSFHETLHDDRNSGPSV